MDGAMGARIKRNGAKGARTKRISIRVQGIVVRAYKDEAEVQGMRGILTLLVGRSYFHVLYG